MEGKTENTLRGIVWGGFNVIASIALPFITRTVIIYIIGVEYVGLGSLFSAILQVLSFTELGLGSALVYSMYAPIANKDDTKVRALLNLYRKSYRIIGCIILVIGLAISPFLDKFISGEVPDDINLYILFFIYLANNVVSYFMFAEKNSLLLACQRDDLNSIVSLIIKVFQNGLQVVILLTLKNYYYFSACIPVCSVLGNIVSAVIAKKKFPQYYCEGKVDKAELKTIEKNVGGMVCQKIGGIVMSSVDTIVISAYLGLKTLGIYNNYYYIITALSMFTAMICRVLVPAVGNSIAFESKEKNSKDFFKFIFIYEWIVIWMSTCMLCLTQPFIEVWIGKDLMLPDYFAIIFSVYFFFYKWFDMVYVYREASGIWWQGKWFPLISAAVNLVLNIVLVRYIGLFGVLISTIICLIFVHDTIGVYILKKYYFKETLSLKSFYLKQLYVIFCFVLIAISSAWLCSLIKLNGILLILARLPICLILPNVLLLVLFYKFGTFNEIKNVVFGRFLRRNKKADD